MIFPGERPVLDRLSETIAGAAIGARFDLR